MITRLLRLISLACCLLVVASFALFADDQLSSASKRNQVELTNPNAVNHGAVRPVVHHAQPRRFIDGAAAELTSPFRSLVNSHNAWVREISSTVLALLVYGLLLGFLARYASGRSRGFPVSPA